MRKTLSAQEVVTDTLTVNGQAFVIAKIHQGSFYSVWKTDKPTLEPNREVVNNIPLNFINSTLTNEDEWKEIIKRTLGKERVKILKQNKERLRGEFTLRPDGELIFVRFMIDNTSSLTLAEIVCLEGTLMKQYKGTLTSRENGHQYLYWIALNFELKFGELDL